jgi:hypothetical protein
VHLTESREHSAELGDPPSQTVLSITLFWRCLQPEGEVKTPSREIVTPGPSFCQASLDPAYMIDEYYLHAAHA